MSKSSTPRTDAIAIRSSPLERWEWIESHEQLERELNAANERIRRLEEAGDRLTNCIACGCNDGGCRTCRETEDNWIKAKETK